MVALKLLFDSLDALFAELRERRIELVRVAPALEVEAGPWSGGIPHLMARVLVTAALDDHTWAEWRHWVDQAAAELGRPDRQVPAWLREKQDQALGEVSRRVDEAGFLIREGILTHDRGVMDTFRL